MDSQSTGCVCNLPIKKKNYIHNSLVYLLVNLHEYKKNNMAGRIIGLGQKFN